MTSDGEAEAVVLGDAGSDALEQQAVKRAAGRIIWFLVLLYLLNVIDRTNVGFAALTMNRDIGLSSQTFGFALGVFYVGYLLFEVPSNVLLAKIGARLSLARMAIGSGMVTVLTAFVQGPVSFYILRFCLGVTEAGYLVGIILYLSYWFPAAYRARYNALFMLALPLAFVVSAAFAGLILSLDGTLGLAGWQWLFILEGSPAVIMGVVSLFYLTDHPGAATWLDDEQRRALVAAVGAVERRQGHGARVGRMLSEAPSLLRNPVVITCGLVYLALNFGVTTLSSWMPSIVATLGFPMSRVGYITMAAPLCGAVAMIAWGRWSDLTNERFINTSCALFVGAAGWLLAAWAPGPLWELCGLIVAAVGVYGTYPLSFTISQNYLAPASRPVAIALIGVIGNIGGVFVPIIIGYIKTVTGSFTGGFIVVAAVMIAAGGLALRLRSSLATGPMLRP